MRWYEDLALDDAYQDTRMAGTAAKRWNPSGFTPPFSRALGLEQEQTYDNEVILNDWDGLEYRERKDSGIEASPSPDTPRPTTWLKDE